MGQISFLSVLCFPSFQCSISFQAAFGMFFYHNSPKCGQIRWRYLPVTECRAWNQICYRLYQILTLGQKTDFLGNFQRFFVYALLRSMNYAPTFSQMKCLMQIHNHSKFHQYNIYGRQVIYFQRLCQQQKAQFLTASGWFFKDYSPK